MLKGTEGTGPGVWCLEMKQETDALGLRAGLRPWQKPGHELTRAEGRGSQ